MQLLKRQKLTIFDQQIAKDPELKIAYDAIVEYVNTVLSSDKFPRRSKYTHINHGQSHVETVLENAATLWPIVCASRPAWNTPQGAFLLAAGVYLHDIAMISGYPYFSAKKDINRTEQDYLARLTNQTGTFKLDGEVRDSPLG